MYTMVPYLRRFRLIRIPRNFRANVLHARTNFQNGRAKRFNKWSPPQSFTIRDIFLVAKQYLGRAAGVYSSPQKRIGESLIMRLGAPYFIPTSISFESLLYSYTCVLEYIYIYISNANAFACN